MNKIKILLIISICFLITGCTVDYNVVIDKNGIVDENISIDGQEIYNDNEYKILKQEINNQYKDILDKYKYDYKISKNDDKIHAEINKKSDLNKLVSNSLYNEVFESYQIFKNKEGSNFKTIGNNSIYELFVVKNYESDLKLKTTVDLLKVNIKFENIIIDNNADKCDNITNTCTWIFDKNNYDKTIQFTYDENKVFKKVQTIENKSTFLIIITLLIVIILLFGIAIIYVSKKNKI